MSIKIKVSSTEERELLEILRLLSPVVSRYKVRKKGPYKIAYIEGKTTEKDCKNDI